MSPILIKRTKRPPAETKQRRWYHRLSPEARKARFARAKALRHERNPPRARVAACANEQSQVENEAIDTTKDTP